MDDSSLTSVEKIMFNSNSKNDSIHKGKIIKTNEGKIGLVSLKLKKSKFKMDSIKLCDDRNEEFIDSDIFTNSEINSNTVLPIEENNNIFEKPKRKFKIKNKTAICMLIDKIVNDNLELKNYKSHSLMTLTNLEECVNNSSNIINLSKNNIVKNNDFILKEDQIENFFNLINKNDLLNTNCSICLWEFDIDHEISLIKTCLHIFHYECLNNWIGVKGCNQNKCPYCKTTIDSNVNNNN